MENALYAMPGPGTLTIEAHAEPHHVILTVSDTFVMLRVWQGPARSMSELIREARR